MVTSPPMGFKHVKSVMLYGYRFQRSPFAELDKPQERYRDVYLQCLGLPNKASWYPRQWDRAWLMERATWVKKL